MGRTPGCRRSQQVLITDQWAGLDISSFTQWSPRALCWILNDHRKSCCYKFLYWIHLIKDELKLCWLVVSSKDPSRTFRFSGFDLDVDLNIQNCTRDYESKADILSPVAFWRIIAVPLDGVRRRERNKWTGQIIEWLFAFVVIEMHMSQCRGQERIGTQTVDILLQSRWPFYQGKVTPIQHYWIPQQHPFGYFCSLIRWYW